MKDLGALEIEIAPDTFDGAHFPVPNDRRFVNRRTRMAMKAGAYEEKEIFAVQRLIAPEDSVLEIGGGLGYMSTFLVRKMGVERVLSYEANPALAPFARTLHALNGVTNAEFRTALLGPRRRKGQTFYVREDFLQSSLYRDSDPGSIVAEHEVPVDNIQHVLDEHKPTALVCDIEGAEADLLPQADLSCLQKAVIELHPDVIGATGVRAVFDAMHAAGLTFFPKASRQKVVAFRKGW